MLVEPQFTMKIRVLYWSIANLLITISYAKLIYRTTNKPCDKRADVKPDVVAKDQSGAHYNFFNSKRTIRSADERKIVKTETNNTRINKERVLVKKPIPKFHEVDSDEDYQSKFKWVESIASVEHEDEDFNINDYEFDINHDEFVSGRKPLEPRMKIYFKRPKSNKLKSTPKADKAIKSKIPRSLIQRRASQAEKQLPFKVTRNTAEQMKAEDYDHEFSTTSLTPATIRDKSDEESDELEDSKEISSGYKRKVRSPWDISIGSFVEKLGERTSNIMTKFLSHLPIFPQLPYPKKDEVNLDSNQLDFERKKREG